MKNPILNNVAIATVAICLLTISACKKTTGDTAKLKEIKRIAVVSVNYNRAAQGAATGNPLQIVKNIGKAFGKYPAPKKEEAEFYGKFTDQMFTLIKNNLKDIQISQPGVVTSDATYLQITENPASNPYYPEGYRKIKLTPENAKVLCEKLNTDAVMTIDYKYLPKNKGIITSTILYALNADICVFNKKGEQVAEFIVSSDYIPNQKGIPLFLPVGAGAAIIDIEFDLDQQHYYEELAKSFLNNFEKEIAKLK